MASIWNEYISSHPFDIVLNHEGDGVHTLSIIQTREMPFAFPVIFGEWLYNLRSSLDYVIWAAAVHHSGRLPPPDENNLQYPIYDNQQAWQRNVYRLRGLADHHQRMLEHMQPYHGNADANYLGWLNRLARVDRHRRLSFATAYLAEMQPVLALPEGMTATLQWGDRIIRDGQAHMARIVVSPWREGSVIQANPRVGIDPEVDEWTDSIFWQRIKFTERIRMFEIFVSAEVAIYEYDCCGSSRKSDLLAKAYRAECDARRGSWPSIARQTREQSWSQPSEGNPASQYHLDGADFPRTPYS